MRRINVWAILSVGLFAATGAAMLQACGSDEAGIGPGGWGGVGGSAGMGGNSEGGSPGGTVSGSSGGGAPPPAELIPPGEDQTTDAGPDAKIPACDMIMPKEPVTFTMSADDSNSMASPVLCRDLIAIGLAPARTQVRTYEFLNYYRMPYPAPNPEPLKFFPELGAAEMPGEYNFQIGLRSFDVEKRRPINMTFVIDTSGSMLGPGMKNAIASVKAVAEVLAQGDRISVVSWASSNNIILDGHIATGPNDPAVLAVADMLEPNGNTDLSKGLQEGFNLAGQYRADDRMNRVVLISDGGANLSVTDAELIAGYAEDALKEGIYLIGVGTSPPLSYRDDLMNTVTEKGHGAYVYLDSPEEAKRMFGPARFDETMEIAARSVSVSVTLPWYFRVDKFYGEQIAPDPKSTAVEPQNLAPNDAMVFHQVLRACDPSVVVPSDPVHFQADWVDPVTYEAKTTTFDTTIEALLNTAPLAMPKGRAIVAYAEALKIATPQALHKAHDLVAATVANSPDEDLTSILATLEKHPKF